MIHPLDVFGLRPLGQRLPHFVKAFRGNELIPASKFGLSSVKIFKTPLNFKAWMGIRRKDRRVEMYNLFNHTPPPLSEGYSVRVTQVNDFRGRPFTYDSHRGTDFAIPVGTTILTAAAGRVLRVATELDRGGLKLLVDHGRGLVTTYHHLARSFVQPGDFVERGQPIALSGASGVELVLCFPWVAPHLHFDTFLNGEYIDPFARLAENETSLWRHYNSPVPHTLDKSGIDDDYEESEWNEEGILKAVETCRDHELKLRLQAMNDIALMAGELQLVWNCYPGLLAEKPEFYLKKYERESRLDLPFPEEEYVGIVFPDEE